MRDRYQNPKLKQTGSGVWFIRPWVDVIKDGILQRAKKTIPLGAMGKREAQAKANEVMRTINRADYVVTSQIPFNAFLDEFLGLHVPRLSDNAQIKYKARIEKRIRPAFGKLMMCEIQPLLVQRWLDELKNLDGTAASWAYRVDLRNIMSSIFSRAIEWGRWKDGNPIQYVHAGRQRPVWEQRKLTDEETRRLLAALPEDLRVMIMVSLFCTLRVSEALALQERHLDFDRGLLLVRQKRARTGNIEDVKSAKARRDIPMGYLAEPLGRMCKGEPERFVFQIETHPKFGRKTALCREDRALLQHFLRPAAQALGIYWRGFGFHAFRREAVTDLQARLGVAQAMRVAGHATMDMSLAYTLSDQRATTDAIKARQLEIMGSVQGKAN